MALEPVAWRAQPGPQSLLLSCPVPDIMFGGARGGGKTDAFVGDWLAHAYRAGKHAKGIFFRRTLTELQDVMLRMEEVYPLIGARWMDKRGAWLMPNGGTLRMRYLQYDKDANLYQGHSYTWIAIDEAGNFPTKDPIAKLKATLRSPHGVPVKMRLAANPGGIGHAWLKEDYITPALPLVPHVDPVTKFLRMFIPSKLKDNQILLKNDPEYVNRLKGTGPPWLVRAWLEGDWDATPEGNLLKSEWMQNRFTELPLERHIIRVVQSWDCAAKGEEGTSYSVCTTWLETMAGYFLVDVFRGKLDFPDLERECVKQWTKWRASHVLIEDTAAGIQLLQNLRRNSNLPLVPIQPKGSKESRLYQQDLTTQAYSVSGLFESGRVFLPAQAPWLMDYLMELTGFPLVANNDQVDSTTQALIWFQEHQPGSLVGVFGFGNEGLDL